MSTAPVASTSVAGRPTLADRVVPRTAISNVALIAAGVAVVSLLAQVEIPMFPVPITGQTLGVMLVGASLGAWRGAVSMLTYLGVGLLGLPVFAGATGGLLALTKPSFGFIIGFVFAAALVGWLAERSWDRRPVLSLAAFGLASLVPFAFGIPYMGFVLGAMGIPNDLGTLLALGFFPFIVGGIVKWVVAASVMPSLWALVRRVDRRSSES
jgi:biotin transport system substrate-specific component